MPNEVERQKRLAAETILDSEGLTDGLEDAAAKRLLKWGVAQAERLANQIAAQDLDRSVSRLRRLIKRVNNLAANRASLSDDEFAAELDELVATADELFGPRGPGRTVVKPLLAGQARLDEAALVEQITALLTPPEDGGVNSLAEGGERSEQRRRRGCGLRFWKRR